MPVIKWIGLFMAGALGNLPGQDLMQRVFASNSSTTARRACLVAGSAYLVFGLYSKEGGETSALWAMVTGTGLWALHLLQGWGLFLDPLLGGSLPLPMGLSCAAVSVLAYKCSCRGIRQSTGEPTS